MSAHIQVNIATGADAAAILAVKMEGWRTTYAEWVPEAILQAPFHEHLAAAEIATALEDETNVAVAARADEQVVGFALCLVAGRDEPYLDSLHVLPGMRGVGIGQALLCRLAVALTRNGHDTVTLSVVEQNERARRFYERLGARYVSSHAAPWAPEHISEADYRWDELQLLTTQLG